MKIENMTVHNCLDAMGSEATEAEAREMLTILAASGHADTRDIGDDEWRCMMDSAIQRAGALTDGHAYEYATDSTSGTITADSPEDAFRKLGITAETAADGATAWVEDEDGNRTTFRA